MTVVFLSNAPSCIIHVWNDELCTMESGNQASTHLGSTSSVRIQHYKPPSFLDEQVGGNIAVKELDGNENENWRYELHGARYYVCCCHKSVEMLAPFEDVWGGLLR